MKNFLRALRHAWPYRYRFALSVFCAAVAAILWGLNFTSIYPVLKLLNGPNKETPQMWVDDCIKGVQAEIDFLQPQSQPLQDRLKELEKLPSDSNVEHSKRDATSDLAKWNASSTPPGHSFGAMRSPVDLSTITRRPTAFRLWLGSSAFSS